MAGKRSTTRSARGAAHPRGGTTRRQASRKAAAKTRRGDVLAILRDDHARVSALFRRFERMKDGDPQLPQLVEQACRELEIHAQLEEELFYPAVRGAIDESELIDEAEVEHESAKQLISRLKELQPRDPKYAATFSVLAEYVRHHVKEEERSIFREARRAKLDLAALAERVQARRSELMAGTAEPARLRTGEEIARIARDQARGSGSTARH